MTEQNHEIKIGGILSRSWEIFKNNFITLLLLNLVVNLPLDIIIWKYVPDIEPSLANLPSVFFYQILIPVVLSTFTLISTLATAYIVESHLYDHKIGFGEAFSKAFSKWGSAVWTYFLSTLLISAGFLFFIIPGFYYALLFSFATYVVILRNQTGMAALRYSAQLIRGRWWQVFFYILLLSFISFIPSAIINGIFTLVKSGYNELIITSLGDLVSSFFEIAIILLFLALDYTHEE